MDEQNATLDREVIEEVSADEPTTPAPFSISLDCDLQARDYLHTHGADTVESCFHLANILHTNAHHLEASYTYRRAFELHSKAPNQFPSSHTLLQVRLLTLLKAGKPLPPHEMADLRRLSIPFANYIEGVALGWNNGDPAMALRRIGNAYEEFHTGEEVDAIYLGFARNIKPDVFEAPYQTPCMSSRIPRRLFMYWDRSPPPEIEVNFEAHRVVEGFETQFFDHGKAVEWLHQYYGFEARNLFLTARHPAEAADFLRLHVIQSLGGWWLDADLRLSKPAALDFMATRTKSAAFLLTTHHNVHNDFFGSCSNSEVLGDALLSVYRNCYLHNGLFIAYKTGPGVLVRALNRIARRSMSGIPPKQSIELHGQEKFDELIEEFDTPYKHYLPHWQSV